MISTESNIFKYILTILKQDRVVLGQKVSTFLSKYRYFTKYWYLFDNRYQMSIRFFTNPYRYWSSVDIPTPTVSKICINIENIDALASMLSPRFERIGFFGFREVFVSHLNDWSSGFVYLASLRYFLVFSGCFFFLFLFLLGGWL